MKRAFFIYWIILSITLIGCQQQTRPKKTSVAVTTDSLTLDLVSLQAAGKLENTRIVTVNDDPVYHKRKQYEALSLEELLQTYTSFKKLEVEKYQLVFECEDGYKPIMPLPLLLSAKSFIAIRDVEAPKGKSWSPIIKAGHEMKAAPFYLVYEGVSANNTAYKWPYNLIKIHLVLLDEAKALQMPKGDSKAQAGYGLFQQNCLVCHAVNKIGGSMGPELNYPKSVTEYWKIESLKAFIQNPDKFRNGVKMPKIKDLTAKDIDAIVCYLTYMADHKL
jgi:cytochrome c2